MPAGVAADAPKAEGVESRERVEPPPSVAISSIEGPADGRTGGAGPEVRPQSTAPENEGMHGAFVDSNSEPGGGARRSGSAGPVGGNSRAAAAAKGSDPWVKEGHLGRTVLVSCPVGALRPTALRIAVFSA